MLSRRVGDYCSGGPDTADDEWHRKHQVSFTGPEVHAVLCRRGHARRALLPSAGEVGQLDVTSVGASQRSSEAVGMMSWTHLSPALN